MDYLFNVQQKPDGSFPQNSKLDSTPVFGGLQLVAVGKMGGDPKRAPQPLPYYLRLTKDGNPNLGATYGLGDGGPSVIDQREVADAGFLELVRLGIKPAYDEVIINSLEVVDAQIATKTTNGTFWRRYNFDGYGETATGAPWGVTSPDTFTTHGRLWPIFAGEPR